MKRFIRWLLGLFGFRGTPSDSPVLPMTDDAPPEATVRPPKTIVPLLIFPRPAGQLTPNETIQVGDDTYYVASPWEVDTEKVDEAIREAEEWLATALSRRIPWNPVTRIDSERTLSEWRSGQIGLIRDEVEELGLPWTDDYIYLAFVRGMGGYAGGIRYESGGAGYAMVGDICLEAIASTPSPPPAPRCSRDGPPTPTRGRARRAPSSTRRSTAWTCLIPTAGLRTTCPAGARP